MENKQEHDNADDGNIRQEEHGEPESSNLGFDFVQLGRSLELSTVHQPMEAQSDDKNTEVTVVSEVVDNSAAEEFVSIISEQEKTKHDSDDYSWTADDNLTLGSKSGGDDNAGADSSLESITHRFEATETVLDGLSTIASLAAVPRGFLEKSDKKGLVGWIMAGLFVVLAMGASSMMMLSKPTTTTSTMSLSPKQDLQSFVALERDRNDMDKLEDLRTEGFQRYARSACVSAISLEEAQRALSIQMTGIPDDVRKLVIERALIEGITHRSSMQDSSSQLESHGRAQSYMAFWSTVYHPRGRDIKYETCVLVAGMEIGMTESIAGYKTEEKKVVVGSTPCECGYLYCAGTCPIFDKVIERTPIFQRHTLSLKQQDDLHRWLVKNAIDAAGALVGGEASNAHKLPNDAGRDGKQDDKNTSWAHMEVLGWKKPPIKEAFYLGDP